jgi:serine/threonine protein kinase
MIAANPNELFDGVRQGPLPLKQVLKYGRQMADALDKAHRSGVVRRDLKPGNIMRSVATRKAIHFAVVPFTPLSCTFTAQPRRHTPHHLNSEN